MLTGIQITFMVFCWIVIFACICSVIYSVVDMIRARHEERNKKRKEISQEQIEEIVAMVEKKIKENIDNDDR